jgi:hypothetical protein
MFSLSQASVSLAGSKTILFKVTAVLVIRILGIYACIFYSIPSRIIFDGIKIVYIFKKRSPGSSSPESWWNFFSISFVLSFSPIALKD